MDEFLHQPGFFGTSANRAGDITLSVMILVAILLTIGVGLALKRRYEAHRRVQSVAVALASIMVLWMMIFPFIDFVISDFMQTRSVKFYLVSALHGLIGLPAFIFGGFVALRGNNLVPERFKFRNYKRYMRIAYALYILTILAGIWLYFTWYVNNPNPPEYGFMAIYMISRVHLSPGAKIPNRCHAGSVAKNAPSG